MKQEYVLGFAFSRDLSSVLLISKLRPEWQKGMLNGVGGKKELGEYTLDAMVREFEEEVGIESNLADWSEVGLLNGSFGRVWIYCSNTVDIERFQQMEEEVPRIYPVRDSFHSRIPNLDIIIPHCVNYLSNRDNATYLELTY